LIAALDHAQPQVGSRRIVQTSKNARALGVQWVSRASRSDPRQHHQSRVPSNGSLSGRTGATQGLPGTAAGTVPTAVNLAAQAATNAVGLALGSINGAFNLDVALSALESSGNGRLLSTPRVSTQNNVAAEIAQGVQIPIQTVSNNTVTVTFRDAALILRVTPQITAANTVIMQIVLDNSSPDFGHQVNGIPPINTQRANTTVLVNDGQTTVIGGIYASQESTTNDRTPGLSSVPILKWLFKRDTSSDTSSELLIFITPRIVR
jgi:type IV pilus assembly protein PilQ